MSRRILSICLVLSLLLLSSLVVMNTNAMAQSATATPTATRTPTIIPPTKTSTAYPGSEFVGAPLSGAAPLTVQFTHINGSILSSCLWTFGDGASQSFSFPSPQATCPSVTHAYTSPGIYTVSLRTTKSTNSFSTTTTKTNYIQVSGPTPTRTPTRTPAPADFSGTPLSGNAPLMVSFTHNLGSVLPPGTMVTCTWTFGDGQSQQFLDTCFNTSHTYTGPGGYTVSLQYSSAGAGSGTVTKPNYISVLSGPTSTRTHTPTLTPTGVVTTPPPPVTLTPTRTITPTPGGITATPFGICSPINADIAAPFTFDGAGAFCWRSTNLGAYVNSWNVVSLKINGQEVGGIYVPYTSFPPAINGYWYVSYNATVPYAHVEFK